MTYEQFICRFEKQKPVKGGVQVCCPAHEDSSPSLSVTPTGDGKILLKCHAGCSTESVVAALGLTVRDLFAKEPPRLFTPPPAVAKRKEPTGDLVHEKTYSYTNWDGETVYQVLRFRPKTFRQRHQKNGDWVYNMDGVERVLYNLPNVYASQEVWVVEGEKDADNLNALGFVATCNVGGAGKWLNAYSDTLKGKDVVICPDNDDAGKKHADLVFESIAGVAKTVKVVKLPASVKDASDFIAANPEPKKELDVMRDTATPFIQGFKMPVYALPEAENAYSTHTTGIDANSFSLGDWLPSFRAIRPLVAGELVFILGDTGSGKTGILQAIAKASRPIPTIMFEMELPMELLFERFVAEMANMTCAQVEAAYKNGDKLGDALNKKFKNLFICSEARLTLETLESYIWRSELKIGQMPKIILLDYIQLMQATGSNRRERVSDIAEGLKVLAKATKTIIIVTSQVRRPEDDDIGPTLHSAKESGSIENSCGLLLGAWRDKNDPHLLNIRVLKSTKGGAGLTVPCNFNGATMSITERAKPSPISDEDVPHYNPGE